MEKMTPVWTDDFSRREDRIGADEAGKRSAEIVDTDVWPPSADENEEPLAPILLPSDHYRQPCVRPAWD
jgi:hypothetical protein